MEQRNLDFEIEVTPDQWAELGRTADALAADDGGFIWDEDRFEEIRVLVRGDDVPNLWRDWVTEDQTYGSTEREVAQFHFNGGRPYAEIDLPDLARQPIVSGDEVEAMRRELESWVRGRWHALMRGSGLHFDRGHIPQG